MDAPHEDTRKELARLVVTRQQDVHRLWRLALHPLGFTGRSVWVVLVDARGHPIPQITEVAEVGQEMAAPVVDRLYEVFGPLLDDAAPGGSIALLLSRPGGGRLDALDRRMCAALIAGGRRAGVRLQPLHVATDLEILPVTPDDLAVAS